MENTFPLHTETFTIRASECGLDKKLSLHALAALFQEVAWNHATSLGIGRQFFEQGKFWALSGLEIQVFEMPHWEERIEICTWPAGIDRLYALRAFEVRNQDGQLLASAKSSWIIVDGEKKRPLRPQNHFPYSIENPPFAAIQTSASNGSVLSTELIKIQHSHLDMNHHVNNVNYICWSIDILYQHQAHLKTPFIFAINFYQECFLGDNLQLNLELGKASGFCVNGLRQNEEKVVFRSNFLVMS